MCSDAFNRTDFPLANFKATGVDLLGCWSWSFVWRQMVSACVICWSFHASVDPRCDVAGPLKYVTSEVGKQMVWLYYNHLQSFGGQSCAIFIPEDSCWLHWYQWYSCFLYSHWCVCMCDFYSCSSHARSYKCVISLHVLKICVTWLGISHSLCSMTGSAISEFCGEWMPL